MEPIILPRISNQKPLVSVVSITYNHEPYIRDCLEGFLMQKTDFPIEVLLHDDASTDHTPDIIREYHAKRPDLFHVIIQRENQHSQHIPIWLKLFEMAQGKYIALCEGDDYWTDPLKLQKQFDFMESHPECSLCYHNIKEKKETDKELPHMEFSPGYKTPKDIYLKWTIPTCSVIFKKEATEIYKTIKTKEKRFIYGDIVLFLSVASMGKIYGTSRTMAVYRRHLGSATAKRNKFFLSAFYNHHKAIAEVFPDLRELSEKIRCEFLYRELIIKFIKLKHDEVKDILRLLKEIMPLKAHLYGIRMAVADFIKLLFLSLIRLTTQFNYARCQRRTD